MFKTVEILLLKYSIIRVIGVTSLASQFLAILWSVWFKCYLPLLTPSALIWNNVYKEFIEFFCYQYPMWKSLSLASSFSPWFPCEEICEVSLVLIWSRVRLDEIMFSFFSSDFWMTFHTICTLLCLFHCKYLS